MFPVETIGTMTVLSVGLLSKSCMIEFVCEKTNPLPAHMGADRGQHLLIPIRKPGIRFFVE